MNSKSKLSCVILAALFIILCKQSTMAENGSNVAFIKPDGTSSTELGGNVQFGEAINGRHAVLLLNCDDGAKATNLNQVVRVESLTGDANDGIVSTKTGSQTWIEIDPLSEEGEVATPLQLMSRRLDGDNVIREGTLELFSTSKEPLTANFSGTISDNYTAKDTRGRVNLICNAPNLTQTLSGINSYTGYTKILAGLLKMNAPASDTIILRGGLLQFLSQNPTVKNLNWSSGGFVIDLLNHSPIRLIETANISTMPQASDAFLFKNISVGDFTIFVYTSDLSSAFSSFAGQSVDCTWAGKTYMGTFTVTSNSVKITFVEK